MVKPFQPCLSSVTTLAALLTLGCAPSTAVGNESFFSDTVSYIKVISDQGMQVAQTMAGVPTSSLEDIRSALLTAKSVEGASYADYSRGRDKEGVPSRVRDIAEDADDAHLQFQETMSGFLMYWDDKNTAHITNGSVALKRCISQANTTVSKINARR